jgi:mycothione reductase
MERFDVLVVGSGSGMTIVEGALNKGLKVALVDKDELGGTCLNRGCIPSKMVIYPIDVIQEIKRVEALGVKATIEEIDFQHIMDRMRRSVGEDRHNMEESVAHTKGLTYYHDMGEFISDYTMNVKGETIQAKNIFLVSGARPDIPAIKGLEKVQFITSREVWDLKSAPKTMIIIGGGYIAAELAHFFSGVGVDVKVLSRSPHLLRRADTEIGESVTQALRVRMTVATGVEVLSVNEQNGLKEVSFKNGNGDPQTFKAESLLVATGLHGNADLLKTEKTGVRADEKGYIKVNDFFETTKPRIWAFGDAIGGNAMFKHIANRQAEVVWHAFDEGHKQPFDFDKVPYAIFTSPQVASVGLTEEEVARRGIKYLVGAYSYADTAYGSAMGEEDSFVKLIVEEETYKILGCHIFGPQAAVLIQEVTTAMYSGNGTVYPIIDAIHIHPALSEVVQRSLWRLQKPESKNL